MKTAPLTHALDHLVLPVSGLGVARSRLAQLGFTVAPDGIHPFGTANCCVFLADGTYLEPLAVVDRAAADAATSAGNVFVSRNDLYRQAESDDGFSAVVFATSDARDDHRRFVDAGQSAGDILDFSRDFTDSVGRSATASFRLAFAAEASASSGFSFACQRMNAPAVDSSSLQRHANGSTSITRIVATSSDPKKSALFLASVARAPEPMTRDDAIAVSLPNCEIAVMHEARFEQSFGSAARPGDAIRFAAVMFGVPDLDAVRLLLDRNAIQGHRRDTSLIVPSARGQGAVFIFEELS